MFKQFNILFFNVLLEIFVVIIFLFVSFSFKNEVVNARVGVVDIQDKLSINVVERGNYLVFNSIDIEEVYNYYNSTILEVSNNYSKSINYNLILKMNIIDDLECYKIMFSGNIYKLNELDFYEDSEYRYFILGNYIIGNKDQNFTFMLWFTGDLDSYEDVNIKYSFMVDDIKNEL